jgi:azurin
MSSLVVPAGLRRLTRSNPQALDKQGRAYVPGHDSRILGATKLIESVQKETLCLAATPTKGGICDFGSTLPGHLAVLQGKLVKSE